MPADFTCVARAADLADGRMKLVTIGFEQIVLVRLDGEFYALEEFCSHAGGSLGTGTLAGSEIVCPLHGAVFCLKTGAALTPPAFDSVHSYPVAIEGDDVMVEI